MKFAVDDDAPIRTLHTLGGPQTNCNLAAREWFLRRAHQNARIELHQTLEDAVSVMPRCSSHALMACAAYPKLHELIFANLDWLEIIECIVVKTHPMVMASRDGRMPHSVATHPAPRLLTPVMVTDVRLATSNAQAAADCAVGLTEGCITTLTAMNAYGLKLVTNFGPLPMAFTIHACRSKSLGTV